MKHLFTLFTILISATICFGQDISIGIRDSVFSKTLNQERELSIYLPPGYNSSPNQKYPILYILDGDYNFLYVAGLLELEGGLSERIPEMILVAISGKGSETYRNNCRPNIEGIKDKGNADEMAQFIEQELIPYVNSNYKTDNFKILSGHSLGGLFVINTALNHPQLFDQYIAISPALWWGENALNKVAKEKVNTNGFKTNVHVSLANERGMGVGSFLSVATSSVLKSNIVVYGIAVILIIIAIIWGYKRKKIFFPIILALVGIGISAYLLFCYYPQDENFTFKRFAAENHNSVGEPTYRWALEDIFKTWRVKDDYFTSAEALKDHYEKVKSTYGAAFNIPYTVLGKTYYTLQDNPEAISKVGETLKENYQNAFEIFTIYRAGKIMEKQPKESEELINQVLNINPKSSESYHLLAKIKLANSNTEMADSLITKAMKLANYQNERQWKINELIETKNNILEVKMKESNIPDSPMRSQ